VRKKFIQKTLRFLSLLQKYCRRSCATRTHI